MKKYSFYSLFLALIIMLMPSCGGVVTDSSANEDTTAEVETSPPKNEDPWTIPEGVEAIGDSLINQTKDTPNTVISTAELSDDFSISADVSIKSKGYLKVYFEAEIDDKGEIKNGLSVTIDKRTDVFIVHLYNSYDSKKQSSAKITDNSTTEFSIRINRIGSSLDCTLYDANSKAEIGYSSLKIKQQKGSTNAISMLGEVALSGYKASNATKPSGELYTNPVLTSSQGLGDPTAYYENGKYYLLSTGKFNCYVTEDLVNYTDIGPIADKDALFGHTYFGGGSIFKYEDIYYLFYTSYIPDSQQSIMCVATSDNVTGPYTQSKQTIVDREACPETSAGAFPLVAEDGKTYLYWYETIPETGNTIFAAEVEFSNGIVTVKKDTKQRLLIATEEWERKSENGASGRVVERPNVYYHNGYYYLFYAGSHWKTSYGQGYAVSRSPLGPYEKYENNPILDSTASLHGVGCSYIVKSPDGSELFLVYHAHTSITSLSRNVCIDRVYFEENRNGADIVKVKGPTVTPQPYPN